MNQYGLEIPYAYEGDGVTVITPERAVPSKMYLCPSCNQICFVRRGEVTVAHFAHLAENKSCSISRETYEHMKAKCVIYDVLSGDDTVFINGITIWFTRSCECGEMHYQPVKLDARLGNPLIEHPIPTGDGGWIRADVAIEKEGKIQLVIEIVATHAVDRDKIKKLGDIRWVEVKASDVLEGGEVSPTNSGNMKPLDKCPSQSEPVSTSPDWNDIAKLWVIPESVTSQQSSRTRQMTSRRRKFPDYIGNWKDYGAMTPPPEIVPDSVLRLTCKETENGTHNWNLQVIQLSKYHIKYEYGVIEACGKFICASCNLSPEIFWYNKLSSFKKNNYKH